VTVKGVHLGTDETDSGTRLIADADGRIRATLTLTFLCSDTGQWPSLVAQGDGGTTLSALLACWRWYGCEPPRMCPIPAPAPDPLLPENGLDGSTTTPPSATSTIGATTGGMTASLHVLKPVVHPGGKQLASIQNGASGPVALTVRYPGGKVTTLHATTAIGSGTSIARASVGWTIPRNVGAGRVRVDATVGDGGMTLGTRFRIR
jgi:hypothetical protein